MGRVLVIDDEQEIGELCSDVLTVEGHEVDYVPSGYEAFKIISTQPYDVAIVDLAMPGMDGLEVTQKLRANYPDLGIIILTGYASVEGAVKAMKLGADDFLSKPVWNKILSGAVASVMDSRAGKRSGLEPATQAALG